MKKVVELKVERRRDVPVGRLLEGQTNVHPDGLAAGLVRSAIGRLHDARPAARGNHKTVPP